MVEGVLSLFQVSFIVCIRGGQYEFMYSVPSPSLPLSTSLLTSSFSFLSQYVTVQDKSQKQSGAKSPLWARKQTTLLNQVCISVAHLTM